MKLLGVLCFVAAAVWSCALFLYHWEHDHLTAMEVVKATPDAVRTSDRLMLVVIGVGALVFALRMERKP